MKFHASEVTVVRERPTCARQTSSWFWSLLLLPLVAIAARAQQVTQTITLSPGWNAVYLEVQPEPRDCEVVFSGLPIESVWGWNRRFTTIKFLQDADKLLPGQPDWLSYFPAASTNPSLSTLFAIHGGRCYLIKSTAAQNFTWKLSGRPVPAIHDWIKGSLNLVGFSLDPAAPPSFTTFFAPSTAHAGQPILRLLPSGVWERVSNPAATLMRSGEAFWINAADQSNYDGPLGTRLEESTGIDFGRVLPETILTLKNFSAAPRSIKLTPQEPEPLPTPGIARVGRVPLSYWKMNLAAKTYGWFPLDAAATFNLAPGQELRIRLAIRRADLASYSLIAGISDYQYQSLLEVADQAGTRALIPVSARGSSGNSPRARLASGAAAPAATPDAAQPDAHAGLWIGSAVIRKISQPASPTNPSLPRPTGSDLQFRLILHVNAAGQARLLQQVTQLWADGTLATDGTVAQPGHYVLVTDDALVSQFTGATLRDGKAVGRRISSVAFGHSNPLGLAGLFGDTQNSLTGTLVTGYDDPLNPFKHRYHPDHDNLDEEYAKVLPEGAESFTITRALQLQFSAVDPEGLASSRWGGDQLGGNYSETITGLHKAPIVMEGVFRLNRVSLISTLNREN